MENIGDFYKAAGVYHQLGEVGRLQKDFEIAEYYYKAALRVYEDAQDSYNASDEYQSLGEIAKAKGNFEEASAYFQKTLAIREAVGDWYKVAATLVEWGEAIEAQGDTVEALKIYIRAFAIDLEHNEDWVALDIKNLERIRKVLGKTQFEAVWCKTTDMDCPEELLSDIQVASEAKED